MGAKVYIIMCTTKYTFTFYQKIPYLCTVSQNACTRHTAESKAAHGEGQGGIPLIAKRCTAESKTAVRVDSGHFAARMRENNEGLAVLRSPQGLSKR